MFEESLIEKQRKYFDQAVKKFKSNELSFKDGRKFTYFPKKTFVFKDSRLEHSKAFQKE
jgi:hypothetical protein